MVLDAPCVIEPGDIALSLSERNINDTSFDWMDSLGDLEARGPNTIVGKRNCISLNYFNVTWYISIISVSVFQFKLLQSGCSSYTTHRFVSHLVESSLSVSLIYMHLAQTTPGCEPVL